MAGDSNVPITAGSGTTIDTYQLAGGDHQQVIREAPASATGSTTSWTLSLTGSNGSGSGVVVADLSRRAVILTNTSGSGTVYLRYDATIPTTAAGGWHDRIAPGGRMIVEKELCVLPLSLIADAASGYLEIALFTAA